MTYSGVFSLSDIVGKAIDGTGQPREEVFIREFVPTVANGYFAGGEKIPGSVSTIERTIYSSDSTSPVPGAHLYAETAYGAAASSGSAGYYSSSYVLGASPTSVSTISKLTYATETVETLPSTFMLASRYGTAVSNLDHGYWIGGTVPADLPIRKLSFATDTSVNTGLLQSVPSLYNQAAVGNQTDGYICGGGAPNGALVDHITYSSDTLNTPPTAQLTIARSGMAGHSSSTAAYLGGGSRHATSSYTTEMEKITYSNETANSAPGAFLLTQRYIPGATGNTTTGYWIGGINSPDKLVTAEKVNLVSDSTILAPGADLPTGTGRYSLTGFSAQESSSPPTYGLPFTQLTTGLTSGPGTGYVCAGYGPGSATRTSVLKTTYATDLTTELPATPAASPTDNNFKVAVGNRTDLYIAGGGPSFVSDIKKLSYSTDSVAAITPTLSSARYAMASGGTDDKGYFMTGYSPAVSWTPQVDRILYSTDTVGTVSSLSLPYGRYRSANISSKKSAFVTGGYSGVLGMNNPAIDRSEYATDTTSIVSTASYPNPALQGSCGIANDFEGYWIGGSGPNSSYIKYSFSSDSCFLHPGATLYPENKDMSAHGDYTSGYILGGSSPYTANVDKFNFATGGVSMTPSAFLPGGRGNAAHGGARSQNLPQNPTVTQTSPLFYFPAPDAPPPITGYVVSGESPAGPLSSGVKLNMSTDAYSAVPSMSIPATGAPGGYRTYSCGTSSPTHGYLIGGYAPNFSNATKTAYVTETTSVIPSYTSEARRSVAQTGGSSTRGYLAGGYSQAQSPNRNVSNVDKLIYSTETFGRQPSANLSEQRGNMGAVSNQTNIYTICGQDGPASKSYVDRINMPSDSTDRIPGANDPQPRQWCRTTYYPAPERGYSSGGRDSASNTWYSLTTRFNFSDETSSSVPGGNLSQNRKDHMAIGNTTDGYQSGGNFPGGGGPNVAQSTTEKLNMSTETYAAAPTANLDEQRHVGSGFAPYMNGNPSAPVAAPPNSLPNIL